MNAFVPSIGRVTVSPALSCFRSHVAVSSLRASNFVSRSMSATRASFSSTVRPYAPVTMQMTDDIEDDSDMGMDMEDRRSGGGGNDNYGRGTPQFEDTKLFVGNLSWSTTDESLSNAFSAYGEVLDSKVVFDRFTGKSRGFGFITFAEADSADSALQNMNGAEVDGRTIRIDRANKRVSSGPRGPRRDMY